MRVPRIYQPGPWQSGANLTLNERASRHLAQVLRMSKGDALILFDGQGLACHASISEISKKAVQVSIGEQQETMTESPLQIHLGLGVSKGERMDIAIQKAVELGVNAITPLFTDHSVVKLDEKRQAKRLEHWQGVMISACEQCGRSQLPLLHPITSQIEWLNTANAELKLVLDPRAEHGLDNQPTTTSRICLFIGPEGGISEHELGLASTAGFTGIRLGPRILRTETAVIAAMTALQLRWGDLA